MSKNISKKQPTKGIIATRLELYSQLFCKSPLDFLLVIVSLTVIYTLACFWLISLFWR